MPDRWGATVSHVQLNKISTIVNKSSAKKYFGLGSEGWEGLFKMVDESVSVELTLEIFDEPFILTLRSIDCVNMILSS